MPNRRNRTLALTFPLLFVLSGVPLCSGEALPATPASPVTTLQASVEEFRESLGIPEAVEVEIVPYNPRMASVERSADDRNTFVISVDASFLDTLDAEEARAVLAHEMGHVWIFTHHPYLQTEELANRHALKLMPAETLDRVYRKVGHHNAARESAARRD